MNNFLNGFAAELVKVAWDEDGYLGMDKEELREWHEQDVRLRQQREWKKQLSEPVRDDLNRPGKYKAIGIFSGLVGGAMLGRLGGKALAKKVIKPNARFITQDTTLIARAAMAAGAIGAAKGGSALGQALSGAPFAERHPERDLEQKAIMASKVSDAALLAQKQIEIDSMKSDGSWNDQYWREEHEREWDFPMKGKSKLTKEAIDPMTGAAMVVAGKLTAANLLSRYGHKIPAVRKLGQGIAGAGARAGRSGRKMVGRPTREALALLGDSKLVKLYEDAHAAGVATKGLTPSQVKKGLGQAADIAKAKGAKGIAESAQIARGVDLQGKSRTARALDYGHKPVGEVARDIGRGAKRLVKRKEKPFAKTSGEDAGYAKMKTDMTFKPSEGMQIPSKKTRAMGNINQSLKKTQGMLQKLPQKATAAVAKPVAPKQTFTPEQNRLMDRRDKAMAVHRKGKKDSAMLTKRDNLFKMRRDRGLDGGNANSRAIAKRDAMFKMRRSKGLDGGTAKNPAVASK